MDNQHYRQCHGCKATFVYRDVSLAGHGIGRYGVNSPECHGAMLELYGREFIDEEGKVYRIAQQSIIDAYAAQHPQCIEYQLKAGIEKRLIEASIQSVNLHLIALYCFLERKMPMPEIRSAMARILKNGPATLPELKPPADLGPITVVDALKAQTLSEHKAIMNAWAKSVWDAWKDHHETLKSWYEQYSK